MRDQGGAKTNRQNSKQRTYARLTRLLLAEELVDKLM